MLGKSLEFLMTGCNPSNKQVVNRSFEGYYGLQFTDAGGVELSIDRREYRLEGHWFWCTYPGPHFTYQPAKAHGFWSHRYVTFRGQRAQQWIAQGLLPFAPQEVQTASEFGARLDGIRSLVRTGNELSLLYAANELERILLDLARLRTEMVEQPEWLQSLIVQLNEEVHRHPDYTALAAEYCMSESTLRRQFRQFTGVPIHTYLLRRRIAAARELLGQTDLPLKTISERLGYRDIYFFSRQFRQLTGIPPSRFRISK